MTIIYTERNSSMTWLNLNRTTISKDDLVMLMDTLKRNSALQFVDICQTLSNPLQDVIQGGNDSTCTHMHTHSHTAYTHIHRHTHTHTHTACSF